MYGMSVQILRLFNVYGAAADGTSRPTVEALFLRQLCQGQRPQVRGHPQNGRDFIHVHDVVRAICLALTRPAWAGAVNIGTGILTTLVDLARMAAHALGQTIEPEIIETGEPPIRFQADTTRAQALLGFRTEMTLQAGLYELAGET
jgi:UDP-glucose 4-epimerase